MILFRLKEMPLKSEYRIFTTSPPRLIINLILIPRLPAAGVRWWCAVQPPPAALISKLVGIVILCECGEARASCPPPLPPPHRSHATRHQQPRPRPALAATSRSFPRHRRPAPRARRLAVYCCTHHISKGHNTAINCSTRQP